jgi:hypothetical protein
MNTNIDINVNVSFRSNNKVKIVVIGDGKTITVYGSPKDIGRLSGGIIHSLTKDINVKNNSM